MNLISQQEDVDKTYLHAKEFSETKYEFLIKKPEDTGIKHLNNQKAFLECSDTMGNINNNTDDYNPDRKIFITFDDLIAGIMINKHFQSVLKELFIRCRKLSISLVFMTQSLFFCSKRCQIKLNSLFNRKNYQQGRIKKYCNKSIFRYRLY